MSTSLTPIDGINEKLKRAHQNIVNLEIEINDFFRKNEPPGSGKKDMQALSDQADHWNNLEVPLRFSVLAAEIIHHFRSSLDHIAYPLAKPEIRRDTPQKIEFPIFHDRFDKHGSPSLKGKIKTFASLRVKKLVVTVQPYRGPNPSDALLWLIHDLDRQAKHRELPLTVLGFTLGSEEVAAPGAFYGAHPNMLMPPEHERRLKEEVYYTPLVALAKVNKGQPQPILPVLAQMEGEVWQILRLFTNELRKC